MFVESADPRQVPGDKPRRVFFTKELHLIVWYQSKDWRIIHGMQLSFGSFTLDHVITAIGDSPVELHRIDEGRRLDASILKANGAFNRDPFEKRYRVELNTLPPEILSFVDGSLETLANPVRHGAARGPT